jgi:hypothetical protein
MIILYINSDVQYFIHAPEPLLGRQLQEGGNK